MSTNVSVYTTATCPYCRMVKEFLSRNDVAFEEKRVDQDRKAYEEFVKLGAQGVPVTIVGNEVVMGFDQGRLQQLLGV